MSKTQKRGFTLIELLVVIAIIGLLASVILASLNTARTKGRDARRMSDLHEIGNAMAGADTPVTLTACGQAAVSACAVVITTGNSLTAFVDPGGNATVCAAGMALPGALTAVCNYRLANQSSDGATSANPTTADWCVSAYLEAGSGGLSAGAVHISSDSNSSIVVGDCKY